MAYFPMFVEIEGKPCLVVGGGKVALRKAVILLDFGAEVTILSPKLSEEFLQRQPVCEEELSGRKRFRLGDREVSYCKKTYEASDLKGMALVIAATNSERVNHQIAEDCRRCRIPVNAVDQIEDCTFIFPAYVRQQDVVAAFSSSGKSPVITQYLKKREQEILTPKLGRLNELLGAVREEVKQKFDTEEERKRVFREILYAGLLDEKEKKRS